MKKLKPLYLYFKDSLTPCKTIFDNMDSTVSKLVVFWLYFYIKANLQSTCVNLPSNLPRMQAVNLSFCASRWKTQTEHV